MPPQRLFGDGLARLPTLNAMVAQGLSGTLRSCHPPITVPAWQVMATSASPGRLGIYGFRHRKGPSYTQGWTPTSYAIRVPTIWDLIGRAGKRSCLVGVPPGYPPKPLKGWSVSCFLTPPDAPRYTYPAELRAEIEDLVGTYLFDVPFRIEDRDAVRDGLFEMTRRRFEVVRHLATTKPWDFLMVVEIGVDRLHHAFWKYFDRAHPTHEPGNRYEQVADDYYRLIDERIGELVELLDDCVFLIVSDHGSKPMLGAFCINEWLAERGWLAVRERLVRTVGLEGAGVDWSKTRAWGWGGYYARIFLNVEGREPQGIVPADQYERTRRQLTDDLRTITDASGNPLGVEVFRPEDLYRVCRGDRPDLMVYLDDLNWRSAGTMGHGRVHLDENDTGPDGAVHSMDGVFIRYDPRRPRRGTVSGISLVDVAPTVLELMGVGVPEEMEGRPIAAARAR